MNDMWYACRARGTGSVGLNTVEYIASCASASHAAKVLAVSAGGPAVTVYQELADESIYAAVELENGEWLHFFATPVPRLMV